MMKFHHKKIKDDIMSLIKDRILQIADNKEVRRHIFFKKINSSYSNFRGKSKKSSPSTDVIVEISSNYPDISINWLLTGNGKMLKEGTITNDLQGESTPYIVSPVQKTIKDKLITSLEENNSLLKEIVLLNKENASLKKEQSISKVASTPKAKLKE